MLDRWKISMSVGLCETFCYECQSNALRAHIRIGGHFMHRLISFNF